MKVWIEKTLVKGRKDRLDGDFKLGTALWTPLKDKRGADIYSSMRDVQKGDVIFHLTDNKAITAVSKASNHYQEGKGVEGSDWDGPAYIVSLINFKKLELPLNRDQFLKVENKEDLDNIREKAQNYYIVEA